MPIFIPAALAFLNLDCTQGIKEEGIAEIMKMIRTLP